MIFLSAGQAQFLFELAGQQAPSVSVGKLMPMQRGVRIFGGGAGYCMNSQSIEADRL